MKNELLLFANKPFSGTSDTSRCAYVCKLYVECVRGVSVVSWCPCCATCVVLPHRVISFLLSTVWIGCSSDDVSFVGYLYTPDEPKRDRWRLWDDT